MDIPELPENIELLIGMSAFRYEDDSEFQDAMRFCAKSISSSHLLNQTQFEKPDSLEQFCWILESSVQAKFEYGIVINWRLENGKTIFYVDVFYEAPNAPFSHKQGAVH